jgi:hypothetical protein
LAIHAKGGESISPKQKDRTTTNFKKEFFNWYDFQIGISAPPLILKRVFLV